MLIDPVSGAKWQLDAYSVDAASNTFRANGDALRTCSDGGAGPPADMTTQSIYERPHLRIVSGEENSVRFDGVDDRFSIPASVTSFAFLHTTGVFDLFLGFRVLGTGQRSVFGNMTDTTIDKGFAVVLTPEGKLTIALGNGAGAIIFSNAAFELQVPRFSPTKLLIRGDGTSLKVSQNFHDFESSAFTGALGAGNASRVYTMGASSEGEATVVAANRMFQGDVFFASMYSSNLSSAQLATMAACIRSRAGDAA